MLRDMVARKALVLALEKIDAAAAWEDLAPHWGSVVLPVMRRQMTIQSLRKRNRGGRLSERQEVQGGLMRLDRAMVKVAVLRYRFYAAHPDRPEATEMMQGMRSIIEGGAWLWSDSCCPT